jgi:hypothetical protein
MRVKTVEALREQVEEALNEIQEMSKILNNEPDDETFMLLFTGYCATVRIELGLLRDSVIYFRRMREKKT